VCLSGEGGGAGGEWRPGTGGGGGGLWSGYYVITSKNIDLTEIILAACSTIRG